MGVAVQTGANENLACIWAGRWFAGMGVGALSMLVPMYNAELASAGIRGSLVALQQLAITFGILISYWIGYGTNCESCVQFLNVYREARAEWSRYRRYWRQPEQHGLASSPRSAIGTW